MIAFDAAMESQLFAALAGAAVGVVGGGLIADWTTRRRETREEARLRTSVRTALDFEIAHNLTKLQRLSPRIEEAVRDEAPGQAFLLLFVPTWSTRAFDTLTAQIVAALDPEEIDCVHGLYSTLGDVSEAQSHLRKVLHDDENAGAVAEKHLEDTAQDILPPLAQEVTDQAACGNPACLIGTRAEARRPRPSAEETPSLGSVEAAAPVS